MQSSGLHARPRVASEGNACERFELDHGAMTLGWSSEGDVLCILSGAAGDGFAAPLIERITDVLTRIGRVRLWLDLYDLTAIEEGFCAGVAGFFEANGEQRKSLGALIAASAA